MILVAEYENTSDLELNQKKKYRKEPKVSIENWLEINWFNIITNKISAKAQWEFLLIILFRTNLLDLTSRAEALSHYRVR